MRKASDLIGEFAARHRIGGAMSAARIVAVANRQSGGAFRAVSFKNGALKIMVAAGPPLYFLKLKEKETMARINKTLGEEKIKRLILCGY